MSEWVLPGHRAARARALARRRIVPAFVAASTLALALSAHATASAQTVSATGSQTLQTLLPGRANAHCFTVTISNGLLVPLTLQSVRFTNKTVGPGTEAQLDTELGAAKLYRDTGNGAFQPGVDDSLKQATASAGSLLFSGLNVSIPMLGSVTLFVGTDIPTSARDGDNLDLSVQASTDFTFAQGSVTWTSAFPIDPAGSIAIDGSSAAQFTVTPVGPADIVAGTTQNLALDVRIPANGYQSDQLQKIAVLNEGTAANASDIGAVRAWVDDGNAIFSPAADRLLGTLSFTGDRWQLTGLSEVIPAAGLRLYVSVDLNDFASNGRTVRLALPSQPDPGMGVQSTNDGPLDAVARNPGFLTISTSNRITLSAVALPSPPATPGQAGLVLADLVVSNAYASLQTLTELAFTNGTLGPGLRADLDSELGPLVLRPDGNGDGVLGTLAEDPPLPGSASFLDGEARFTGLAWSLPGGQSRHLFLTGDVSLSKARDGDLLAASIQGPSQVQFDDTTRVVAGWPLDSGVRSSVNGMVAGQITLFATSGSTLGANEGPALALDFLLPPNGYASDSLSRLSVVNLGSAGTSDLAEVRLWRDGGDGQFTPGAGDDQDLGPMPWQVDRWQSGSLTELLSGAGARFFVSIRVSGSPVDSSTVRLAIPVGGIANASQNDGPLDQALANPNTKLLSNAPLLVSMEIQPQASTVGQPVSAHMVVRNVGPEAINGITPSTLTPSGAGSLSYVSGSSPPSFDLAPGAADSFHWVYTAGTAGDVRLTGGAGGTGSPSGAPRNALASTSNTHQIFTEAQSVSFAAASSLPGSVNRGQPNVGAISLGFTNPGGTQSSTVRLRGFRVRLEDGTGAGIVPSGLLARAVVSEGGTTVLQKTALETSGSIVDLTFASPVSIPPGASVSLALSLDILSSTTVSEFRLSIPDSTVFTAEDALSGAPVSVTHAGGYPVRTSVASVVAPATELDFAGSAPTTNRVGRGQSGVTLLQAQLQSPGVTGITSDVRLYGFSAVLEDTNGATIPRPADYMSFVRVEAGGQTLVARTVSSSEGPAIVLALALPLTVPANTAIDLAMRGDIAMQGPIGPVRLRLLDPSTVDARDANTFDPVPAAYTPAVLLGNVEVIEARAESLRVAGTPLFPSRSTVGASSVTALRIGLFHPASPGTGRIALDGITVLCRDEARRPLTPSTYLSRVALTWNGALLAEVLNPPASGGSVTIPLPRPMLEPGERDSAEVVVDFAATAPVGSIELMVFGDGIEAEDANVGTAVVPAPDAGAELPVVSGLCRLESPPRNLVVDLVSDMPAALAPDGRAVSPGRLVLTNTAQAGADSIRLDHLTLLGADRLRNPASLGAAATRVDLYAGSTLVGQSGTLTPDSVTATISLAPALRVPPATPVTLELRFTTPLSQAPTAVRLGCDAAGIGVIQPSSALLQVQIAAAQGRTFPLWTSAGVFGDASLHASYANFPNPFAAGRATTSFAYYLRDAGRVTLRIFTPQGEGVVTLVDAGDRPAGMNQTDSWDGRNGAGAVVRNGVYLAELRVEYADGSRERVRRKVAVVR